MDLMLQYSRLFMTPQIVFSVKASLSEYRRFFSPIPWEGSSEPTLAGKEGFIYEDGCFRPFHDGQSYVLGSSIQLKDDPNPEVIAASLGLKQDQTDKSVWSKLL